MNCSENFDVMLKQISRFIISIFKKKKNFFYSTDFLINKNSCSNNSISCFCYFISKNESKFFLFYIKFVYSHVFAIITICTIFLSKAYIRIGYKLEALCIFILFIFIIYEQDDECCKKYCTIFIVQRKTTRKFCLLT